MATNFPNISNFPGGSKHELRVKKPNFLLPVNFDGAGVESAVNKLSSVLGPRPEGVKVTDVSDSGSYGLPGKYVHLKWEVKPGFGADATIALSKIKTLLASAKTPADIDRIKSQYATILDQNPTLKADVNTLTSEAKIKLSEATTMASAKYTQLAGMIKNANAATIQTILAQVITAYKAGQVSVKEGLYLTLGTAAKAKELGYTVSGSGTDLKLIPPPGSTTTSTGTNAVMQTANFTALMSKITRASSLTDLNEVAKLITSYKAQGQISSTQHQQLRTAVASKTLTLQKVETPSAPTPTTTSGTSDAHYEFYKGEFDRKMANLANLGVDSLSPSLDSPSRIQGILGVLMNLRNNVPTEWPADLRSQYAQAIDRQYRQANDILSQAQVLQQIKPDEPELPEAKVPVAAAPPSDLPTVAQILGAGDLQVLNNYESLLNRYLSTEQITREQYIPLNNAISLRRDQLLQQQIEDEDDDDDYGAVPVAQPAAPTIITVTQPAPVQQMPTVPTIISTPPMSISQPSPVIITQPAPISQAPVQAAPAPAPSTDWAFNTPAEGPPLPKSLGLRWPWVKSS